jgi:hypothetical protein
LPDFPLYAVDCGVERGKKLRWLGQKCLSTWFADKTKPAAPQTAPKAKGKGKAKAKAKSKGTSTSRDSKHLL